MDSTEQSEASQAAGGWCKVEHGIIRRAGELGHTNTLVLLALMSHANQAGECWPSIDTIAGYLRINRRSVIRAVRSLQEAGLIVEVRKRSKQSGRLANLYVLAVSQGDTRDTLRIPQSDTRDTSQGDTGDTSQGDTRDTGTRTNTNKNQFKLEPSKGAHRTDDLSEVLEAWNQAAQRAGFTQVAKLTDKRRATLRARLADAFWRENWRAALARIEASSFCRGGGSTGWVATFDFFMRPDSVAKAMEGAYEDRRLGQTGKKRWDSAIHNPERPITAM